MTYGKSENVKHDPVLENLLSRANTLLEDLNAYIDRIERSQRLMVDLKLTRVYLKDVRASLINALEDIQ